MGLNRQNQVLNVVYWIGLEYWGPRRIKCNTKKNAFTFSAYNIQNNSLNKMIDHDEFMMLI